MINVVEQGVKDPEVGSFQYEVGRPNCEHEITAKTGRDEGVNQVCI